MRPSKVATVLSVLWCIMIILPLLLLPSQAATYPYVASKNSKVYHMIECGHAANILKSNRVYFATRSAAEASGRSPCSYCGDGVVSEGNGGNNSSSSSGSSSGNHSSATTPPSTQPPATDPQPSQTIPVGGLRVVDYVIWGLLIALALTPGGCILYGLLRPHRDNGPALYLLGIGLYALVLGSLFFQNKILVFLFTGVMIWLGYNIFLLRVYWKARRHIAYARCFFHDIQSYSFHIPKLAKSLTNQVGEHFIKHKSEECIQKETEFAIYHISIKMIDSERYRHPWVRIETDEYKQLQHICRTCLKNFLYNGYISYEQYDSALKYLEHGDPDIDGINVLYYD